jgi:hypothetical protein
VTELQSTSSNISNFQNFELGAIERDLNFKNSSERCQVVFSRPTSNLSMYYDYNLLPWTHIRSRCSSMVQ